VTVVGAVLWRDRVKALLGHGIEARLAFGRPASPAVQVDCPWDLWWVCARAAFSPAGLVLADSSGTGCARCWRQVLSLVAAIPPGYPDPEAMDCGCLHRWAVQMRQPEPGLGWPALRIQVALVKPGTPTGRVRRLLAEDYRVVGAARRQLTRADVRRLYPDAYGTDFIAAQDRYLVGQRVDVLVLAADGDPPDPGQVKARVRGLLGGTDMLRNHVHMPDSPGDTLCDLAHLAGRRVLSGLYGRYDRDRVRERLDYYRAVLVPGSTQPDPQPGRR
jgi:hypothetical protein